MTFPSVFLKSSTTATFPSSQMTLETSPFQNFLTTAVLLLGFALFVRSAAKEEEAVKEEHAEKKEKKKDEKKADPQQAQLLTCDGLAFRLGCGALFLALRNKLDAPVADAVSALRASAAESFPPQGSSMETPLSVQLLALSGLLGLVGFLLREAKATEEEKSENEEKTEEKPAEDLKRNVVQLLSPDGIAFRLALSVLFLAARDACAPYLVALVARVRAAPAPAFPMDPITLEAPSFLQLLSISVLLATFTQLILLAKQEEERKEEEEQEKKEEEDEKVTQAKETKKTLQKQVILFTVPGFARRLSLGTLLIALREFYRSGSWDAVRAFLRTSLASMKYTSLASMKLETPLSVCLLSIAGLCFGFAVLLRDAEAEEKTEASAMEEKKVRRQHTLVSADGIAMRLGVCCGIFGVFDVARSSGILLALRELSSARGFPPAGATLETPLFICLLCLAVLCCGFAALLRSAEAEEKKQSDEKKKENNGQHHKLVSADGITMRLGVCCGVIGLFEAVRCSGICSTLRTASKSFASPLGGFPSAGVSLETPPTMCLLSLAALCCGFALLVRSAEADEKEQAETDEKKEAMEVRQHALVSVDRIALRLGACCVGFAALEAARSSVLPVLANGTSLTPELTVAGGLLVAGTGLVLTDSSRFSKAK